MTGVDRVANELALALKALVGEGGTRSLVPRASSYQGEGLELGFLSGHAWEQVELPFRLKKGEWLLSPCNVGPIAIRNQILIIHDAQVFSQPQSYSPVFRQYYKAVLPLMARRARVVVTVSDYSRRELEYYGVFPKGKAIVVHNGADHMDRIDPDFEVLSRNGLKSGRFILALGSLSEHKNLKLLIKAAADRPAGSYPLVIAGGGNRKVFKEADLGNTDGVVFLGRVSDAELKALYQHAAIFAFPSKTEGFGLPPLEAMRSGAPVLASTGGAIPEVCGSAPIYADPNDVGAWTRALLSVEGAEAMRKDLSEAARVRSAEFTWVAAARQIIAATRGLDGA